MVAQLLMWLALCRERGRSGSTSGGLGGAGGGGETELQLQRRRIGARMKAIQRKLDEVSQLPASVFPPLTQPHLKISRILGLKHTQLSDISNWIWANAAELLQASKGPVSSGPCFRQARVCLHVGQQFWCFYGTRGMIWTNRKRRCETRASGEENEGCATARQESSWMSCGGRRRLYISGKVFVNLSPEWPISCCS